jgi:hypothetical protein
LFAVVDETIFDYAFRFTTWATWHKYIHLLITYILSSLHLEDYPLSYRSSSIKKIIPTP